MSGYSWACDQCGTELWDQILSVLMRRKHQHTNKCKEKK